MNLAKTDVTGRFGASYSSLGGRFQAQNRGNVSLAGAYENMARALSAAGRTVAQGVLIANEETPAEREAKLKQQENVRKTLAANGNTNRVSPEAFEKQAAKDKEALMKNIPEDQWEDFSLMYEQEKSGFSRAVLQNRLALDNQKQQKTFMDEDERLRTKALNAASHGDSAGYAQALEELTENRNYMFTHGFIDGTRLMRMERDFTDDAAIQTHLYQAKQLFGNSEQLNAYLKNIDSIGQYSPERKNSIKQNIAAAYSDWQALNRVNNAKLVNQADFGIKAYGLGLDPDGFDFDATMERLNAAGETDKAGQLQQAYMLKKETSAFARLAPEEMNAEIALLRQGAKDQYDLNRLKLFENIAENAEKSLQADPLQFAARYGVIKDEGLNITDAEKTAARLENARIVQKKYNLDYAPVITQAEAQSLQKLVYQADSEQKTLLAASIAENFGDNANQVFEQISAENPEFAVAGKIFSRNPQIAKNIISGMEIGKSEKGYKPENNLALQNAFGEVDEVLSGFSTEDVAKVKTAIVANMTYMNKTNGLFGEGSATNADKVSSAQEAIEQVLGGRIVGMTVGGGWFGDSYKLLLPENVEQANFEDWLENLTNEDVGEVFVGEMLADAEDIRESGRLHYDDNNKYTVTIGGEYLRRADGSVLVLTYGGK